MASRLLAIMTAVCAFAGVGAMATGTSAQAATCSSGQFCVWSGPNYTGQRALVSLDDTWHGCVTAAQLGLVGIRSAKKNGVACQYQASLHSDGVCGQSTDPSYVGNQTPNITPAALSLDKILIPC